MDKHYRVWAGLLITLVATSTWAPLAAQEPPAAREPEEPAMVERKDPAVEAILATKPGTPREWARAAKILADLGEPDLARGFLKQVLDAKLDQQQLVGLEEHFGAAMFTEMASRANLAPEAQQLNEAVLAAVSRHLQDPARLPLLVEQLQSPTAEARYQALVELRRARDAAVGPLMGALADPNRSAEHANVRAALVELGSDAVDPLIAMLESEDPKLTVAAVGVLGDLKSEKAAVFLTALFASEESDPVVRQAAEEALLKLSGRTPSRDEAARLLAERAREYFDRRFPLKEDVDGKLEMWIWDGDANQLVLSRPLADDASLLLASRLAREAFSVAPDDPQIRVLFLASMLERAAYENGLDTPLEQAAGTVAGRVAEFGPEVVEEVLTFAMASRHAPAAAAAARILGQIGNAETLLYQGAKPAPLVRATWHTDRRARFAAVEAILRLDPAEPFAGSSRVAEALFYFASSGGGPRALVAGPSTEETQRVGGFLVPLGYELDTAINGREAIQKLLASPDYDLALVDAALQRPTVDHLLQLLRHDCRTAQLPVGVLARAGQLERARHMTRNDPLGEAFSRPHTQEAVLWQVEQLMKLVGRERVLPSERAHEAAMAVKWLADLTGREQTVYDVSRAQEVAMSALLVPQFAPDATVVLGNLGTPQCQQALVDLASRWTQPPEIRLAAAQAFRRSSQQRGILLTTEQILLQYDRYNQSESMDARTQQVLGLILDCIEARTRVGQQEGESAAPRGNEEVAERNAS